MHTKHPFDMSTAAEAIIEQVYAIQTAYFMTLAGCTLIIYDYTITFGREIDLFWRSKRSIALVLFHTIRYSMLLLAPIHLSAFGPHSEKLRPTCRGAYCPCLFAIHSHCGVLWDESICAMSELHTLIVDYYFVHHRNGCESGSVCHRHPWDCLSLPR
ncbi:hypothetical protein C8Q74DRAFT_910498 [Fomes fomentarius]|nr:hypothetical protein C8Q74DRAFT_910498 [Fomes fomentarius]